MAIYEKPCCSIYFQHTQDLEYQIAEKNKPKPKFSQNGQNYNSILNLRLKMRTAFIKPRPQNNNNNNKQTNSQQWVLFGHYISLSKLNRHHPCVHQIFWKTNIFYLFIRTCTCAYQGSKMLVFRKILVGKKM